MKTTMWMISSIGEEDKDNDNFLVEEGGAKAKYKWDGIIFLFIFERVLGKGMYGGSLGKEI